MVLDADDGVSVDLGTRRGQIASQHVRRLQAVLRHVHGVVHVGDDVGLGDGVAVGIGELVETGESALGQIGLDSRIRGNEAGVVAVGGEHVHEVGTLYNLGKAAVLRAILQVIAHHLAVKGVEVFAGRLVGAGRQRNASKGEQAYQGQKLIFNLFHLLL